MMNESKYPALAVNLKFSPSIPESQYELLKHWDVLNRWVKKAQLNFEILEIEFLSTLVVQRKEGPRALFAMVHVNAVGSNKQHPPGRLLLRGDAVVILVVLKCQGQDYLLLVKQDRLGAAESLLPEAIAGMLDGHDPFEVALKEIREETSMTVTPAELFPLTLKDQGQNYWLESVGLTDESIFYYAVEREVSPAELKFWNQRQTGCAEENEWIETQVIPFKKALTELRDSKTVFACFLYQEHQKKKNT